MAQLPGMAGKVVEELEGLIVGARGNVDAVGIDRAAQRLSDELKGCYGEQVAEMFNLPTIDNLVSLGIAQVVNWDRGNELSKKVQGYLTLAEDFGLEPEQVEQLEVAVKEWHTFNLQKADKVHKPKGETVQVPCDMPFPVRVTYRGEVVEQAGVRTGECRWAQLVSKVKTHYKRVTSEDQWSDELKGAWMQAKQDLLSGKECIQVWEYEVCKTPVS